MVRARGWDERCEELAGGAEEGCVGKCEMRDDVEVEFGGEAEERR